MNILKRKPLYFIVTLLGAALVVGIIAAVTYNTALKTSSQSGIKGTAVVDGGCPVVEADSPCPTNTPQAATITVTDARGQTVATTETDSSGHFQVSLAPGTYTVSATNTTGAPVPTALSQQVRVTSEALTDITIHFDSGIR